ncbi:MAG: pyroglutamyl-peptidase I [Chloroflexi bacterium]|nr:pyroglutamyl-peptidase I [Chloroflexota bacterium]
MKFLLTGFESFGGSKINPSEQVVRALAREKFSEVELVIAILPVDGARAPEELIRAIETHQPDVVLSLGEASSRSAISIERVAINLRDDRIPDNAGNQSRDEAIVRDAPAAYFCTLPVRAMLNAARACGVPAELSLSAGSFLCNQIAFTALHFIATKKINARAGFVHLPALPQQAAEKNSAIPSMGLETMLVGARAAIEAIRARG